MLMIRQLQQKEEEEPPPPQQTTQAAEVEVPDHSDVSVYTYHHEDQLDFQHDSTVPHHIPTSIKVV